MQSETVGFGGERGGLLFWGWYEVQGGFLSCNTCQMALRGGGPEACHGSGMKVTRTWT